MTSLPPGRRDLRSRAFDEKAFDDAVTGGDWDRAALSLAALSRPVTELAPLTIEQLRLLQDGVIRTRCVLGSISPVLQSAIAVELRGRGIAAGKVAAGTAFGKLETRVEDRIDGDQATGSGYSYKIVITFLPDAAAVDAEEIAFIQTVRLVETASGSNRNPDKRSGRRQTPSATNVDRLSGRKHGWYGMKDDGTGSNQLSAWKRSAPSTPARMQDRAGWNQPLTTWQFETLVVCRSGTDLGKVYGALRWGFRVDADLRLTEQPPTVTNKPSPEATTAVGRWNDQATGSVFDRNTPGQLPLPTLR